MNRETWLLIIQYLLFALSISQTEFYTQKNQLTFYTGDPPSIYIKELGKDEKLASQFELKNYEIKSTIMEVKSILNPTGKNNIKQIVTIITVALIFIFAFTIFAKKNVIIIVLEVIVLLLTILHVVYSTYIISPPTPKINRVTIVTPHADLIANLLNGPHQQIIDLQPNKPVIVFTSLDSNQNLQLMISDAEAAPNLGSETGRTLMLDPEPEQPLAPFPNSDSLGDNAANGNNVVNRSDTLSVSLTLRSTPDHSLAPQTLRDLLKKYDFYCAASHWSKAWANRRGKGLANDFALHHDGMVVVDRYTGLMWQQSGSRDSVFWGEVENYIIHLNTDKDLGSGFADWRLPTLDEAMSLMESAETNGLHIDPIFDNRQRWIWTSDKAAPDSIWVVRFDEGRCNYGILPRGYKRHVRAVRNVGK